MAAVFIYIVLLYGYTISALTLEIDFYSIIFSPSIGINT